jgi:hypothetical protein
MVRLQGVVRDVPKEMAAPMDQLHIFAESGDRLAV